MISVASPASVTLLLAGGGPLRWSTVGLKHDETHVIEARSCNQEEDDFWRQPENTDLLGPSDCGRIIRFRHDERRHAGSPFNIENHGENHASVRIPVIVIGHSGRR